MRKSVRSISHRTQEVRFLDFLLLSPVECSINLKLCYRSVIEECLPPTSTPLSFHQNGLFPCLCCPEQLFLWRMFSSGFSGLLFILITSRASESRRRGAVNYLFPPSFCCCSCLFACFCLLERIISDPVDRAFSNLCLAPLLTQEALRR